MIPNQMNNRTLTITEVEACIEKAKKCAQELLSAARQLPEIDKEGSSECHFAEELYAKKEEAQAKAEGCLEELDECRIWVEQQMHRCQSNLSVVSSGKNALHTDIARDRLSEAEERLVALYKKLEELLEKIQEVFEQLQAAIKEASQKQFPGRIPRKNPGFYNPSITFPEPNMAREGKNTSLDNDLRQMIAKGPH